MSGWVLILILVAVIGLIIAMMMPSAIKLTAKSLKIGKSLAIEVPFKNIDTVQLKTQYPKLTGKVHGFDTVDIKIGVFDSASEGQITMNLFIEHPPFIEVIHSEGLLIFNFNNSEKTEKLYKELITKIAGNETN